MTQEDLNLKFASEISATNAMMTTVNARLEKIEKKIDSILDYQVTRSFTLKAYVAVLSIAISAIVAGVIKLL